MELQSLLYLILGLFGLWLGANVVVNNAVRIAKQTELSRMFIGLTLLGLGTQIYLIISFLKTTLIQTPVNGAMNLTAAVVIGSNMTLISLTLGLAGLISTIEVRKSEFAKNGLILTASTLLVLLLAADGFISQSEGLFMLLLYAAYLLWLQTLSGIPRFKVKFKLLWEKSAGLSFLRMSAGLLLIGLTSNLVAKYGIFIAEKLQFSQVIIGLFLIGAAPVLPVMAVALTAAWKKLPNLLIGNLIGSSLVGLLISLGGSALIAGCPIERGIAHFDLAYLSFTCVVVMLFLMTRGKLDRKESVLILCLYIIYILLKVLGF